MPGRRGRLSLCPGAEVIIAGEAAIVHVVVKEERRAKKDALAEYEGQKLRFADETGSRILAIPCVSLSLVFSSHVVLITDRAFVAFPRPSNCSVSLAKLE